MSDALNYLLKVRKDVVEPYFKALKQGGKHLDVKTRSLLSVITKVDAQTEAGLKQYLVRALRDGNSADEILDVGLSTDIGHEQDYLGSRYYLENEPP